MGRCFAYFFGIERVGSQALMVVAATPLNLVLVLALDRPFSGAVQVGPETFEQVLFILGESASPGQP